MPVQTQPYITKDIAAQRLGLSSRRVLELAAAGKIRQQESYNPQTRRRQTVLSVEDVDRLAKARNDDSMVPATTFAPPPHVAALNAPEPVPQGLTHERPWLTLDDAEEYSGLPASFLRTLIDDGKLPALDVGVRSGGRWRVSRRDLDALEGVVHHQLASAAE